MRINIVGGFKAAALVSIFQNNLKAAVGGEKATPKGDKDASHHFYIHVD